MAVLDTTFEVRPRDQLNELAPIPLHPPSLLRSPGKRGASQLRQLRLTRFKIAVAPSLRRGGGSK